MFNNRTQRLYFFVLFIFLSTNLINKITTARQYNYNEHNPYDKGYNDNDGRARVWQRVEENGINHKLYRFLSEQSITNCFEYMEEPRLLRLRCLSRYELFDVDIFVYRRNPNSYKNNQNYLTFNATNWNPNSRIVSVSIDEM